MWHFSQFCAMEGEMKIQRQNEIWLDFCKDLEWFSEESLFMNKWLFMNKVSVEIQMLNRLFCPKKKKDA